MQPYFFPYAGYFRLLAAADAFVIFDCVQFPRRGRVHRTDVRGPDGRIEWLTLPLSKQRREITIRELAFAKDARKTFDQRLRRLAWIESSKAPSAEQIRDFLHAPFPTSVVDYLETGIRMVATLLNLSASISKSSTLNIDQSLRAQERVIAIAKAMGATRYINSPGGRKIYDEMAFERAGIELRFLNPYHGGYFHMLRDLMTEPVENVRDDVLRNCQFHR